MTQEEKEILKKAYMEGFTFVARDAKDSGGRLWAFESLPVRVVNTLDSIWNTNGAMISIHKELLFDWINWEDEPFEITREDVMNG